MPGALRQAAIEELRERAEGGGLLAGFPLSGVKIEVYDAELQEEGSDEVAFRIAARGRLRQGLKAAGPVLLEPVMKVEVTTPEDYMGELVNDLQQRRGIIAADRNAWRDDRDHRSRAAEGTVRLLQRRAKSEPRTCGQQHGAAELPARTLRRCRDLHLLNRLPVDFRSLNHLVEHVPRSLTL